MPSSLPDASKGVFQASPGVGLAYSGNGLPAPEKMQKDMVYGLPNGQVPDASLNGGPSAPMGGGVGGAGLSGGRTTGNSAPATDRRVAPVNSFG